jgi:molecular chaperone GrpE (heat shock protein)
MSDLGRLTVGRVEPLKRADTPEARELWEMVERVAARADAAANDARITELEAALEDQSDIADALRAKLEIAEAEVARLRELAKRTRRDVISKASSIIGGYDVFRGVLQRLDAAMERKAE